MQVPLLMSRVTLCLASAGPLTAQSLYAQCADGTPPPCEVQAAQVVARATPPPSEAERGRSFLILPFRNITRSADHDWLVEGSPVLLADAFGQWDEIRVVRSEQLYPALARHGLSVGDVIPLDSHALRSSLEVTYLFTEGIRIRMMKSQKPRQPS